METHIATVQPTEEEMNQVLMEAALAELGEPVEEFEAFVAAEKQHGSPEQVANEITARFFERNMPLYKGEPVRGKYNPREHSSVFHAENQGGYYVYYSFPVNAKTPVASFWTFREEDGSYSFEHVDLGKVMSQFLMYYRNRGDMPPPKKGSRG
jgi:hypothetical protein